MPARRWQRKPPTPMPLFAGPPANRAPTSQLAAAAAEKTGRAETLRVRVLAELRRRGETGATNEELAEALGVAEKCICPARHALVHARPPLARDSGRTRPTSSGGQAAVIVAATA